MYDSHQQPTASTTPTPEGIDVSIEWGKLGVILTILAGSFGCLATGALTAEQVLPIVTLIIGYVTGNGRLASQGKTPVPMIGPSEDRQVG